MDASSLPCEAACGILPHGVKQVTAAASEKDGVITVTLANLAMTEAEDVELRLDGWQGGACTARILSEEVHAFNTFEQPDRVAPKPLTLQPGADGVIRLSLPACSVVCASFRA